MLKKAKTGRIGTRVMAYFLTLAMLLSLVGVMPEPIWAEDEAVTSWDFSTFTETYEGLSEVVNWNSLLIDTSNGKIRANGSSAQLSAGTLINVPVTGPCIVKITSHNSQDDYADYVVKGVALTKGVDYAIYNGTAGYVTIQAGSSHPYISKIELLDIKSSWDFGEFTDGDKIQGAVKDWKSLVVDATASTAKLATNGDSYCAAFNEGTIIKVPVTGPCAINITAYNDGYAKYTVNEDAATGAEYTYNYEGEAGFVEITATAQAYLVKIQVKYPEPLKYVLDMSELATQYANTTFEQKKYTIQGNDYFTFYGEAKLTIDAGNKEFTEVDGSKTTLTHRFNPGGGGNASKRNINFTTSGEAVVKVYWVSGGDGRQMYLLDSQGAHYAKTDVTSVKNELYVSELEISDAGEYFLAGVDGTNYIYRVEVTPITNQYALDMSELATQYANTTFEQKNILFKETTILLFMEKQN